MKNKDINLNLSDLPAQLSGLTRKVGAYKVFLFFLAVALFYGFMIWRIHVFSSAPASVSEESEQTTTHAGVDKTTADKIQSLQDNSVSVKSLFDTARNNPFQE